MKFIDIGTLHGHFLGMSMQSTGVTIERAGGNYSAYSPDLPGCVSTGRTPDEVKRNMAEAITLHLEGLREDGLPVPEPSSSAAYIDVPEPA